MAFGLVTCALLLLVRAEPAFWRQKTRRCAVVLCCACSKCDYAWIVGGYDTKVHENVEYHDFLYKLGSRHGFRCYSPVHDGGDGKLSDWRNDFALHGPCEQFHFDVALVLHVLLALCVAGDFDEFGVPKAAPADAEIIFVPSFTDAQRRCAGELEISFALGSGVLFARLSHCCEYDPRG